MTDGFERIATVASVRDLLGEHAPDDGYVLVNRVGNLNVYDAEFTWLGYIELHNASMWSSTDEPPHATWAAVKEEE